MCERKWGKNTCPDKAAPPPAISLSTRTRPPPDGSPSICCRTKPSPTCDGGVALGWRRVGERGESGGPPPSSAHRATLAAAVYQYLTRVPAPVHQAHSVPHNRPPRSLDAGARGAVSISCPCNGPSLPPTLSPRHPATEASLHHTRAPSPNLRAQGTIRDLQMHTAPALEMARRRARHHSSLAFRVCACQ